MALIKCIDCGKEFSDKADFCPNCGGPNDLKKSNKKINLKINKKIMIIIGAILLLVVVGFILFKVLKKSEDNKFIGSWNYQEVSSKNGGTTYIDLYLNEDNTCKFYMKYILKSGKEILNNTSLCTWRKEGKYIVTVEKKNSLNYFLYDKDSDIIWELDKETKDKENKYIRK